MTFLQIYINTVHVGTLPVPAPFAILTCQSYFILAFIYKGQFQSVPYISQICITNFSSQYYLSCKTKLEVQKAQK
jgi:hypothetical protein